MIKLICIHIKKPVSILTYSPIEINNIYYIKPEIEGAYNYFIYDENNRYLGYYPKELFMQLDEYREKQINTIIK